MLKVPELNLGSVDAINYKTRDQKEFFARILYREEYLEKILEHNKYFLIGEKGTGKTSYAVFLNNSDFIDTRSKIVSLSQTDYRRFVSLIENNKFSISSYVDIWKVIILLIISDGIAKSFVSSLSDFPAFSAIQSVIDEYYHLTYKAEVDQSLDFVENATTAAEIMAKHPEAGNTPQLGKGRREFPSISVNLAYLERRFRGAISSLKLPRDFILFIDGIDIRPEKISYESYIECIRGLANAAWELNSDFSRISAIHLRILK